MRKIIMLLAGVMAMGLVNAQTVVFDPSAHELGAFQESDAMEIVDIDGMNYLKVELAGWNSTFQVSSTVLNPEYTNIYAIAKYEEGTSGFTIDQVNTAVKLIDNTSDDSAEIGIASGASSAEFTDYYGGLVINDDINTVTTVQLWGQETTGWSAVEGDFLYVGKVMAYKAEADVLFDPATLNADDLPEGWEIVEEDGEALLKVKVDEWNTTMGIIPFDLGQNNKFNYKVKYDAGDSGYEAADVLTFVKLTDAEGTELGASQVNPAPTELTAIQADVASESTATTIQFAVQETTGWSAVADAYVYVSKITVESFVSSVAQNAYTGQMSVYPNPAYSDITIEMDNLTSVAIYSVIGEKVADYAVNTNAAKLNVSDLNAGVYIVRAMNNNGQQAVSKITIK